MILFTLSNPFELEIAALCAEKLWLIDNCDALGSRYNGKLTGTFGQIGPPVVLSGPSPHDSRRRRRVYERPLLFGLSNQSAIDATVGARPAKTIPVVVV